MGNEYLPTMDNPTLNSALQGWIEYGAELSKLIAACDSVLDWADANARWFDISTAPIGIEGGSRFEVWHKCGFSQEVWSTNGKIWHESDEWEQIDLSGLSHWRPLPPPPSNPPLPEALERLGEVLRRIKGEK